MKPTRRKTVLGLGALATGSGAVFSSAAFQSSVNPTADMRVVVEDNLVVEAGANFRSGYESDGNYLSNPPKGKFYGTNNDGLFNNDTSLGDVSIDELPAARVNDDQNSDLYIQTAIKNRDDSGSPTVVNFPDLLQVSNEGTETAEVGISYKPTSDAYGEDTKKNGGEVANNDVANAYNFKSEGGDGGKISPDTGSGDPAATTTVGVGNTEQIGLTIDLTVGSIAEDIANAAELNNAFGGTSDTVQLLDQIRFGNTLSAGDQ